MKPVSKFIGVTICVACSLMMCHQTVRADDNPDNDQIKAVILKADSLWQAAQAKNDTAEMITTCYSAGVAYFNSGAPAIALEYFMKLLDMPLTTKQAAKAYFALGMTSSVIIKNQGLNTFEFYQKAEDFARQAGDSIMMAYAYFGMSQYFFDSMGGYKLGELSPTMRDSLATSTRYAEEAVMNLHFHNLAAIAALSLNYAAQGQFDKALAFRDEIEGFSKQPELTSQSYNCMAAIYNYMKNYNEAIRLCQLSIENAQKLNKMHDVHHACDILAFAYQGKGDYRNALLTLQRVRKLENIMEDRENEMELIATQVKFDIREKEALISQTHQRNQLYRQQLKFIGALAVLLALIVVIVTLNRRTLAHKNRVLVQQINKQSELLEELKAEREEIHKLKHADDNLLPDEEILFKRIEDYMAENKPFTDPDFNDAKLANTIMSNRTYVREAIKLYTGQTFGEYVTDYRLLHARAQLQSAENEQTIEAIAINSGFRSRSTFHSIFRARYGLTPKEFVKLTGVVN